MSLITAGKKLFKNNDGLIAFALAVYNRLPFNNRVVFKGRNNKIEAPQTLMKRTVVKVCGSGNRIIFGRRCTLRNCKVMIAGNNNTIQFGEKISMIDGEVCIEDDGNTIQAGDKTAFLGRTHLACIEGTKITIGEGCLFSSEIVLRTGDSHAILNLEGERINPSQDITLGDHIWVGFRSLITKGVSIQNDSVVATGALVTKAVDAPNVIIGGAPAKVIKRDVTWDINR